MNKGNSTLFNFRLLDSHVHILHRPLDAHPNPDPMMVDPAPVVNAPAVEKKGSKPSDWHPEYVRFAQESRDVSIAEL